MLSQIKKSFKIVNNNLILSQPFVLYLLLLTMAMSAMFARIQVIALGVLVISMALFSVAFLAGWFYMAKKVIQFENTTLLEGEEKAIGSVGLFKEFFPGVGEYFLPLLGSLILYFVVLFLFVWGSYEIGVLAFGAPDFDYVRLNEAAKSYVLMKAYIATLSHLQVLALFKWVLFFSLISVIFQFLTMWWFVPLYFDSKNPFSAFVKAIKFLLNNWAASLGIFLFLTAFNVVVSSFNSLAGNNIIFLFLSFILFFYYATYYIVLIFLYYGEKTGYFNNSWSDSDGQEQLGDLFGGES